MDTVEQILHTAWLVRVPLLVFLTMWLGAALAVRR